jgi:hypothetical protein
MLVITALRRQREEDHELNASLGYIYSEILSINK